MWKRAESSPSWKPTRKTIWQGCYDVWSCEQDRLDSVAAIDHRMQEAVDLGLIYIVPDSCFPTFVWKLTELGQKAIACQ